MKSARRQFNSELPDETPLRVPTIPGGKKKLEKLLDASPVTLLGLKKGKKGGNVVPPPEAVKEAGKKHFVKVGGKIMTDGRGNLIDTTIMGESTVGQKDLEAGKKKKGGNILSDVVDEVKGAVGLGKKKKGGNIFSDIGDAVSGVVDDVKSVVGLGKKPKAKKGKGFMDVVEDSIENQIPNVERDVLNHYVGPILGNGKKGKVKVGGESVGDYIEGAVGNAVGNLVMSGIDGAISGAFADGKKKKKGGNFIDDLKQSAVESIPDIAEGALEALALGKKKKGGIQTNTPVTIGNALEAPIKRGGKAKRQEATNSVKNELKNLEASIKQIKKVLNKVK